MTALPRIEAVVPHDHPMILLDEVVACDDERLVAALTIRESSLFLEQEGVPAHIGLEYMAQACGAYAGTHALRAGEAVRIGFLLGTRRYTAHVPWFRRGERLAVSAAMVYRDEEMGVFACRIEIDGLLAAEAQLSVYQPGVAPVATAP
jgi:predicted hotdog family 3-hydroxylacyl-ACP dehydratase